jgi:hypothetical protein
MFFWYRYMIYPAKSKKCKTRYCRQSDPVCTWSVYLVSSENALIFLWCFFAVLSVVVSLKISKEHKYDEHQTRSRPQGRWTKSDIARSFTRTPALNVSRHHARSSTWIHAWHTTQTVAWSPLGIPLGEWLGHALGWQQEANVGTPSGNLKL